MNLSQEATEGTTKASIPYRLTPDQAELVLIALWVLDRGQHQNDYTIDDLIPEAMQNFNIDGLHCEKPGELIQYLWDKLYEHRMTPWDHLRAETMDIDTSSLSDEDGLAIWRDIEAKYGKIVIPEES